MNRDEALYYLAEKRELLAPVAYSFKDYRNKDVKYKDIKSKTKIPLIVSILGVYISLTIGTARDGNFIVGLLGAVVFFFVARFCFKIRGKAKEDMEEAKSFHGNELSRPEYRQGAEGFPSKFYNYDDVYRLYALLEEGRALTLQDAFNLLETQQFQEKQLSIQEATRALQQDIANNARVAAHNSKVAAINAQDAAHNTFQLGQDLRYFFNRNRRR